MIRQISVFVENKSGRLFSLTNTLAEKGIDLLALSLADTAKYGILRMIVRDPDSALKIIQDASFTASETPVLGVEVEDEPGGLARMLRVFKEHDIPVEYLYSFVRTAGENAMIIFRVEDVEKAGGLLAGAGYKLITEEMI